MTGDGLITIGGLARACGLTASALRFYDDCGLLVPVRVDEVTGYRYYGDAQVDRGVMIRRLREIGVPLEVVSEILHGDGARAGRLLDKHVAELARRAHEAAAVAQVPPLRMDADRFATSNRRSPRNGPELRLPGLMQYLFLLCRLGNGERDIGDAVGVGQAVHANRTLRHLLTDLEAISPAKLSYPRTGWTPLLLQPHAALLRTRIECRDRLVTRSPRLGAELGEPDLQNPHAVAGALTQLCAHTTTADIQTEPNKPIAILTAGGSENTDWLTELAHSYTRLTRPWRGSPNMVTIIGGGIAGTILAGALARDHHPVTVYERQPATDAGAFMTLDGHAQASMASLGVPLDTLHQVSHEIPGFRFHYLPEGRNAVPSQGHRFYSRAALMQVLTEFASSAGANIRYDCPITDIDPTTATLHTTDGPISYHTDLIIAADGIDSLVRARLEPDRTPTYAGQIVIYGTVDRPVRLTSEPSLLHFHGRLGEDVMPLSSFGHMWNDQTAFWFTRITQDPIPQHDVGIHPTNEWADAVRASAPAAVDLIDTLLSATDTVHVSNARNVELTDARAPQTPIILCGDADHAITPAAARGAREAIEDGAAIYHAITTNSSPADAMAARREQITTERDQLARVYSRARA